MQIQRLVRISKKLEQDFISTEYPKRINEFITTISQQQNKTNISILKGVGDIVLNDLIFIDKKTYSEELNGVLSTMSVDELYSSSIMSELKDLQENGEITAAVYNQKLNEFLIDLRERFNGVNTFISKVSLEFSAFDEENTEKEFEYTNEEQAVIGLHLVNKESYEFLGNFTELMNEWDTALYLYSRCASVNTEDLKPRVSSFRNGSVWAELIVSIGVASDIISIYNAGIGALNLYKEFKAFLEFRRKGVQMDAFDKIDEGLKEMKNQILDAINNQAKECLEKHEDSESIEVGANAISNVIYGNIINGNNITLIDSSKADPEIIEQNHQLRQKVRELEANQDLLEEIKLLVDRPNPKKNYKDIDEQLESNSDKVD